MTTAHAEELAQLRADAAREREELRAALESRAQVLLGGGVLSLGSAEMSELNP